MDGAVAELTGKSIIGKIDGFVSLCRGFRPLRPDMPFSQVGQVPARGFEILAEEADARLRIQPPAVAGLIFRVEGEPVPVGPESRLEAGPGRCAGRRRAESVHETHAAGRQAVDVRGLDDGVPGAAEAVRPVLVRDQEEDVADGRSSGVRRKDLSGRQSL